MGNGSWNPGRGACPKIIYERKETTKPPGPPLGALFFLQKFIKKCLTWHAMRAMIYLEGNKKTS